MKLSDFALLTDENVHPEVVRYLEQQGFDVLDVKAGGLTGSSDVQLVQRAYSERRVLVTHDRDFGRLVFSSREPFWGIIYLRPGHLDPAFTLATLRTVLDQEFALEERFILVAERRQDSVNMRLRHLG